MCCITISRGPYCWMAGICCLERCNESFGRCHLLVTMFNRSKVSVAATTVHKTKLNSWRMSLMGFHARVETFRNLCVLSESLLNKWSRKEVFNKGQNPFLPRKYHNNYILAINPPSIDHLLVGWLQKVFMSFLFFSQSRAAFENLITRLI